METAEDFPLPQTRAVIEQGIADGLHLGAQVYISLAGRVVADAGLGMTRRDTPLTADTVHLWHSAGKPLGPVAVAQSWEQGRLDLDDAVAAHLPEFAQNGKAAVTLRHLLTHTGGFRAAFGARIDWSAPWDEVIAAICAMPLEDGWAPGRKAGYHAQSSWFVLGELVRRLSGRGYGEYVREAIWAPLGIDDAWFGVPADRYAAYGPAGLGAIYTATDRRPIDQDAPPPSAEEAARVNPGAGLRCPASGLGRFYEMLLAKGAGPSGGARALSPQSVEALTAPHRVGMHDATFNRKMDWGLGFLTNSAHYGDGPVPYGFGAHASPRAFGHGGVQSAIGFADPEFGLAVAWVCNGQPGEPRHVRRNHEINTAIYEDLGLA